MTGIRIRHAVCEDPIEIKLTVISSHFRSKMCSVARHNAVHSSPFISQSFYFIRCAFTKTTPSRASESILDPFYLLFS